MSNDKIELCINDKINIEVRHEIDLGELQFKDTVSDLSCVTQIRFVLSAISQNSSIRFEIVLYLYCKSSTDCQIIMQKNARALFDPHSCDMSITQCFGSSPVLGGKVDDRTATLLSEIEIDALSKFHQLFLEAFSIQNFYLYLRQHPVGDLKKPADLENAVVSFVLDTFACQMALRGGEIDEKNSKSWLKRFKLL
ncbi:MAG: hypothetical protein NZO16_01920 [Deltaproteobacteria bacterium]|nr:hypothetical protein [Deltaproteobacteria bacterium]